MAGYAQYTTMGGGKRVGSRLTHQEEEIINVSFHAFSQVMKDEDDEEREIIDVYKLVEAFQSIDASSDIEDIKLLIADIDENGDADIDLAEWRHIMSRKFLGEEDDSSFTHVFSMLDSDKDGHIPLVEFRKMLMEEGQAPLSEQEVDELLMFADTESDGLINYRKFLRWLSNPDGYHKDMSEQKEAIKDNKHKMDGHEDNNRPHTGAHTSNDSGAGVGSMPKSSSNQVGPSSSADSMHSGPQLKPGIPGGAKATGTPAAAGPAAAAPAGKGPGKGMAGPPKAAGPGGVVAAGGAHPPSGALAGPPQAAGAKAAAKPGMMAKPPTGGMMAKPPGAKR